MSFYSQFASFYEQVFPFREEVFSFLEGYAGGAGSEVLDAGCGPGHYCGKFAGNSYGATGIDLDPEMITIARQSYPSAEFHVLDISQMRSLKSTFHLIYSIGNVAAHLPSGELGRFATAVYERLENGGCWILQVVNWDYFLTLKEYVFPVKTIAGGALSFRRNYTEISRERVAFSFSLQEKERVIFEEKVTLYPVTSEEYRAIFESAGLYREAIHGGFNRSPYLSESDTGLVMVFRKQ